MDDVRPSNSGFLSWQRTMSSRFALPLIQDAANLIMEHRGVIFGDCADTRVDDDEDDNEYERRVLFRNGSSFIKPILVLDLFWNLFFVFLSVIVLVLSAEEKPTAPLRFWLSGYAVQCLFHVFFVFVAYLRSSRYRLGFENRGAQDELRLSHNRIRVMKRLEALNTMVAYIWWVFGFYWIVMGGQALLEGSPRLYWLAVVFLAFDVFFIIFCTGMAFVGFFAVCCIIPFLAYGYTMNFLEGASEDEIRALPKYRFHQDNPLESFDNDKKQEVGMTLVEPGYNGHTTEHTLNAEDSACCICLAQYIHGVQLCMLPCNHHFHTRCIVKWLRITQPAPSASSASDKVIPWSDSTLIESDHS